MNHKRLRDAERRFFTQYPTGFDDEKLIPILKKHKVDKMTKYAHEVLSKDNLQTNHKAIEDITKLITKSSLVSVFEKTRFRNVMKELDHIYHLDIVDAIYQLIHEEQEQGFTRLVELLKPYKLAKWPIITSMLLYYFPTKEVFIKPTTVKQVIAYYELQNISYTSNVNYQFYTNYRQQFLEMAQQVDPSLRITNGHFSGFLMMTFN